MLAEEPEDVGANKILIISHSNPKHVDDTNRIMLNSEVAVSNNEILKGSRRLMDVIVAVESTYL